MSESRFSIGHIIGIGITIISSLAAIVTQCEPPKPAFGDLGLDGQGLSVMASGPVIDPRYGAAFEELHWWDSMPFDMNVLAEAGVRFVDVEQLSLPGDQARTRANMDLGPSVGERRQLVTYTLDPKTKLLRIMRIKDFRHVQGQQSPSSVSARFEDSGTPGYQTVFLTELQGPRTSHDQGYWQFADDGSPSMLQFDHGPDEYFLKQADADAILAFHGVWDLRVFLNDQRLSSDQIWKKCLRVKSAMLKQAGMEDATEVSCFCQLGSRDSIGDAVVVTSSGEKTAYDWDYDSSGRVQGFRGTDFNSKETLRSVKHSYDENGRISMITDSSREAHRLIQFSYLPSGWPEKVVAVDSFPDGKVWVAWRTFFKFKRS